MLSGLSLLHVGEADHGANEYHLDPLGNNYHVLPPPTQTASLTTAAATGAGTTLGDGAIGSEATTPVDPLRLHSNPGAAHTIYLDFDGHTTSGTAWNSFVSGADIVTPAFNITGDASFADSELARIHAIWERVAEDFIPFDVNVTTEEPALSDLSFGGNGDDKWGVRVVIGGDGAWYGSAGGVAYVGSFNWNSDTPVFVFEDQMANGNEKYTAEAISHEAGHALGLYHDGRLSPAESYYRGHGSGATGWAPIMGVGYYQQLTQWSKGDYASANNLEDDLAIITSRNGFGYRADDHGDSSASASPLSGLAETVDGSGIIETNDDTDVFTFLTGAGTVQLNLNPFHRGPNLDIAASLFDAAGSLITSSNPLGVLSASITAALSAGQYYLHVTGTGEGDPLADGYSDYGSLGSYSISGTIVPASGGLLSIAATDADRNEGDSGNHPFTFTITRSGDTSAQASVNWSVSAAGSNPVNASDFDGGILPAGTVTFAAGETSKLISIPVRGDLEVESDEGFEVVLSDASSGNQIAVSVAAGTIRNDDAPPAAPGITVVPSGGLTTTESGDSATLTVVLDSEPSANVVIPISSSNPAEGITDVASLTFTSGNWATPQTVRVTGVDDAERDGNIAYTIVIGAAVSQDVGYDGLDAADVDATNQDNERGKKTSGDGGGGGGGGGGRGKSKAAAVLDGAIPETVAVTLPQSERTVDRDPTGDDEGANAFATPLAAVSPVAKAKANATARPTGATAATSLSELSKGTGDATEPAAGTDLEDVETIDCVWAELGRA